MFLGRNDPEPLHLVYKNNNDSRTNSSFEAGISKTKVEKWFVTFVIFLLCHFHMINLFMRKTYIRYNLQDNLIQNTELMKYNEKILMSCVFAVTTKIESEIYV